MCNWHVPVCVSCRISMHPKKNGVAYVETHEFDAKTNIGIERKEVKPYKIWEADMWACQKCGVSVLIGFGKTPYAFYYEETFNEVLENVKRLPFTIIEQNKEDK
jgi:hypothetical protein